MKEKFIAVFTSALLFLIMGCKKVDDYIEFNPTADMKCCSIMKIVFSSQWSPVDSIRFTYNLNGDPLTGTRPDPTTGAPNYEFRYDRKGRLTDFIGCYANPYIGNEFWHIYFYDGTGKIVCDSNYIFCRVENGHPVDPRLTPEPDMSSLTWYKYDCRGRIIADSTVYLDGGVTENQYAYDAQGNKTGSTYDQKANFHRTNKVWMFLDRDYSLNNPFVADSYNSNGLPLKVDLSFKVGLQTFIGNYFNKAQITYSCK